MRMPFGKWKGRLLEDIPLDYLHWLRDNTKSGFILDAVRKELARRKRKEDRERSFDWFEGN